MARLILLTITCLMLVTGCQSAPSTIQPTPAPTTNPEHPYDEKANANQDITAAIALAKADKKYVLLDFGGNWCPDCIVLARYYERDPLKSFVEKNYHLVAIDVGQFDKNLDIDAKYGNPINGGVPAIVVINADGKIIGTTRDGALESAHSMSIGQVLNILKAWTPS